MVRILDLAQSGYRDCRQYSSTPSTGDAVRRSEPRERDMAKSNPTSILINSEAAGAAETIGVARAQILVVDDDRAFCETIARCLAQRGYDVVCADGGESAAEAIAEQKPDLIVTDMIMPGMDGIDLMNWLNDNALDIPVIAISGEGYIGRDGEA